MSDIPNNPPPHGMSNQNAFKMGCMITLGVFAAFFITFCALPAACVMSGVALSPVSPSTTPQPLSSATPVPTSTPAPTPVPTPMPMPVITPTATPVPQTMDEARLIYKAAMDSGLILSYDKVSQTIVVNEATWKSLSPNYQSSVAEAATTLVGYEKRKIAFKMVGNTSGVALVNFVPDLTFWEKADQFGKARQLESAGAPSFWDKAYQRGKEEELKRANATPSPAKIQAGNYIQIAMNSGIITNVDIPNLRVEVNGDAWNQKAQQFRDSAMVKLSQYMSNGSETYFRVYDNSTMEELASYSPWSGAEFNN